MIALAFFAACSTDPGQRPGGGPGGDPGPGEPRNPVQAPTGGPIDPPQDTCDAGTDVWVQRVFPLVLGRKVHGAAEVLMWSRVADQYGRAEVVRALTRSGAYNEFWTQMISDMLQVSRSGPDVDSTCFEYPEMMAHDGSLASHIRGHSPDSAPGYGRPFNMADVILDGLAADDLGVIWQANVFARTNYVPICANTVDDKQVEYERRVALGDEFLATYPNRSLTCIECHNSEYSTTDDPDPALDRTWGVAAYFEKALFADSAGPTDPDTYYAMHRYYGVVSDPYYYGGGPDYPLHPWGMDSSCGSFRRMPPTYDFLDVDDAYFGGDQGTQGSIWDLEAMLSSGYDAMHGSMLSIQGDESVPADQALSYLTAQHVVDQVWEYGLGAGLTIPYGFSRNRDQQQQLEDLTDQFVTDGWSLRELLVSIATNPIFNDGLPSTCGAAAYGLDPVVNPYSVEDPDLSLHGNGTGDLVHRHFARALIRSVRDELEWPPMEEYFGYTYGGTDTQYDLEIAMGVFLSRSIAGFNGTDFQGALTWEKQFATCSDPSIPGGFLLRARDSALQADATVEELALAVKDRLTARGVWEDDDERDLAESLLEVPLDTRVADADPTVLGRNLGLFCGVVTLSPDFFLAVEPRPPGPVPPLPLDYEADCARLASLLDLEGIEVECDNWMPVAAD